MVLGVGFTIFEVAIKVAFTPGSVFLSELVLTSIDEEDDGTSLEMVRLTGASVWVFDLAAAVEGTLEGWVANTLCCELMITLRGSLDSVEPQLDPEEAGELLLGAGAGADSLTVEVGWGMS